MDLNEKQRKYAIKVLNDIKGHYQLQAYGFQFSLDAGIEALSAKLTEEVLDEIKAEIENDARDYSCDEFVDGINHALEIIDKHISREGDNENDKV